MAVIDDIKEISKLKDRLVELEKSLKMAKDPTRWGSRTPEDIEQEILSVNKKLSGLLENLRFDHQWEKQNPESMNQASTSREASSVRSNDFDGEVKEEVFKQALDQLNRKSEQKSEQKQTERNDFSTNTMPTKK